LITDEGKREKRKKGEMKRTREKDEGNSSSLYYGKNKRNRLFPKS